MERNEYIFGIRAVMEAIEAGKDIDKVFIKKDLQGELVGELFEMIKNGNKFEKQVAKEKLINCNQRFVVAVAKRYATNDNILDLINEGNIGLMEALENFKHDVLENYC